METGPHSGTGCVVPTYFTVDIGSSATKRPKSDQNSSHKEQGSSPKPNVIFRFRSMPALFPSENTELFFALKSVNMIRRARGVWRDDRLDASFPI